MAMILHFHPQRSDAALKLEKNGDTLIVNGERFDFSGLEQGAILPPSAIASDLFVGPVGREGADLRVHLVLPLGDNPGNLADYSRPVRYEADGPMRLPKSGARI